MTYIEPTDCCALYHLVCSNYDAIKEIKKEIKYMNNGIGYTYFAITTEKEKILEKRLIKVGFKHIHIFPSVSSPGQILKMWTYTAEKKSS